MTAFTFSAQLDDKGRVTVPAQIRNLLNLDNKDQIQLGIRSINVERIRVENYQEAIKYLQQVENVESFYFEDGVLEVVKI